MKKILICAFLLSISVNLFAGPFGLEFGWSLEDLEAHGIAYEKEPGESYYWVAPLKKHSYFPHYIVAISESHGLYRIYTGRAVTTTDGRGEELKSIFSKLQSSLDTVYGVGQHFDFISYESPLSEPGDFMASLVTGDRVLDSFWFPEGLSVGLKATAYGPTSGFVSLTYEADYIIEQINDEVEAYNLTVL